MRDDRLLREFRNSFGSYVREVSGEMLDGRDEAAKMLLDPQGFEQAVLMMADVPYDLAAILSSSVGVVPDHIDHIAVMRRADEDELERVFEILATKGRLPLRGRLDTNSRAFLDHLTKKPEGRKLYRDIAQCLSKGWSDKELRPFMFNPSEEEEGL